MTGTSDETTWARLGRAGRVVAAALLVAFAVAYLSLSLWQLPHVVMYPDSPSYLSLSFLGHAERLWTVPLVYKIGGNNTGRIVLQSVIGLGAWSVLAFETVAAVRSRVVGLTAASVMLLIALSAPVLQWNRAVLSESVAISLTVLLLAVMTRFVRVGSRTSLVSLLVVATFWVFSRQAQALIVVVIALAAVALAIRVDRRRLALIAAAGFVVIGAWGIVTTEQSGSDSITAGNAAVVVQFRVVADPDQLVYLISHGMPLPPALDTKPPLASAGEPVGVDQFGDGGVPPQVASDPQFATWAIHHAQADFLGYAVRHPASSIASPLRHTTELMTMDPDYAPGRDLPSWAGLIVYGAGALNGTAFSGGGAASSAHPTYLAVLLILGGVLFIAALLRRRLSVVAGVGLGGVLFGGLWGIEIWNGSAAELPRLFVIPAVLVHVSLLLMAAASLDGLIARRGK